jgi:hypothetical protein
MNRAKLHIFLVAIITAFALASPVRADWCLQVGQPLGGALGFFRFVGPRPTAHGTIVPLTGRVAGMSPAFGTATVYKDGSGLELGVTFFADATEGQFDITLSPPLFRKGDGFASYGAYGVNRHATAKVVSCSQEP